MSITPLNISREFPGALFRNELRSTAPPTGDVMIRVRNRLDRLQKRWNENSTERRAAEDAACFLEEDQGKWLKKNPGESDAHWRQKPKLTVDLANKVLRDVATVYQTPPRRIVSGELSDEQRDEAEAWLGERIWGYGVYGLNATMLDLDRWLMFHSNIALEPRYQPDLDGTGVDGIEAIFYRRHEFEALPFEDDPRRAEAVVFPVRQVDKKNLMQEVTGRLQVAHYWDHEVFARLVDWRIDVDQGREDERFQNGLLLHGFGYIPVVFMRERLVQRTFYSPPAYPNLVRVCKEINKLKTENGYFMKVPGTFYTDQKLNNVAIGADAITTGSSGQQLNYVRMDANLAEIRAGIQREVDDLGVALGMAPGSLVMDPQAARSGVAIAAEQRDTDALRQERVPKHQRWESMFHRAAIDIYNLQSSADPTTGVTSVPPQLLDGSAEILVIHQRPKTQLSQAEKREQLAWEREHGLISREDMLKEAREELTDQEVEERLARAESERQANTPIQLRSVPAPIDEEQEED